MEVSKNIEGRIEKFYVAQRSYNSKQKEIELVKGDEVSLQAIREDGWSFGIVKRTGQAGYLPTTYLKGANVSNISLSSLRPRPKYIELQGKKHILNARKVSWYVNKKIGGKVDKWYAKHDYDGFQDGDLKLKKGDVLTFVKKITVKWSVGMLISTNDAGYFPSCLLCKEEVKPEVVRPVHTEASTATTEKTSTLEEKKPDLPPRPERLKISAEDKKPEMESTTLPQKPKICQATEAKKTYTEEKEVTTIKECVISDNEIEKPDDLCGKETKKMVNDTEETSAEKKDSNETVPLNSIRQELVNGDVVINKNATGSKPRTERNKLIDEIVESEGIYHNYINILNNIMGEVDFEYLWIFSNIKQLTEFSKAILYDLNMAAAADGELIGDVYKIYSPFLKMYIPYASNLVKASERVDELLKNKKSRFSQCLLKHQGKFISSRQTFQSLMIMPIQRIPRHVLLLKGLLENTPESHEDYKACKQSLAEVDRIAIEINEKVGKCSEAFEMLEILQSIIKSPLQFLFKNGRRLVRKGMLKKLTRTKNGQKWEDLMFFLLNDYLLYARPIQIPGFGTKFYYRNVVKVTEVEIGCCFNGECGSCETPEESDSSRYRFRVKAMPKQLSLAAESTEDRENWIWDLKKHAQPEAGSKEEMDSLLKISTARGRPSRSTRSQRSRSKSANRTSVQRTPRSRSKSIGRRSRSFKKMLRLQRTKVSLYDAASECA